MKSGSQTPAIEPDDDSVLTPDVDAKALAPEPAPTGSPPNVGKLASLLGEGADARHVALVGLFLLAVFYTLHLAQAFFLPIVLAILLDFLLSPVVRTLRKFGLPEPLGAAIVMLGLLAVLVFGVYRLAGPASEYIALAPESIETARNKLRSMRGSVEQVTDAAEQVERVAAGDEAQATAGRDQGTESDQPALRGNHGVSQRRDGRHLSHLLLARRGGPLPAEARGRAAAVQGQTGAVTIARETEAQISLYLFTTTLINLGVGVATGIAMYLLGMPNAVLWGVVAAVLNFVPYVGAVANTVLLALAAFIAFDDTGRALLVPGIFLARATSRSRTRVSFSSWNRHRIVWMDAYVTSVTGLCKVCDFGL